MSDFKNPILSALSDRSQNLDSLRDIAFGYADRLVREHVAQLDLVSKGAEFVRYMPRLTESSWGFSLGWYATRLHKSGAKWVVRSAYIKQNKDGTHDPRKFSFMVPAQRALMTVYEPRYVQIRQLMSRLTRERKVALALEQHILSIEGLDEWVAHLPPGY